MQPPFQQAEITELLALREAEAVAAQRLIDQGADPGPFRTQLQGLVQQQEQLQSALQIVLTGLQGRYASGRAQQQRVQEVHRLLKAGTRPGRLNERR
jgi:hypothetical protein